MMVDSLVVLTLMCPFQNANCCTKFHLFSYIAVNLQARELLWRMEVIVALRQKTRRTDANGENENP